MISCKIFLPLIVTVFKVKLNLQLLLIFYSSIRSVLETTFISEQIAKNRFGALLEISDKFITKFNSNSLESLLYNFKKSGYVVLLERSQFVPQKLELLGMGKDLKIKHSVSSPTYKVCDNFFHKKALLGGTNFWANVWGNVLHGD